MTVNMIIQSQSGNKEATLDLIKKFEPLLKKNARLLNYEDAYNDLVLDFLELIQRININQIRDFNEGAIIIYIQKSLRNCFLKRLKSIQNYMERNVPFSEITNKQMMDIDIKLSEYNNYEAIERYFIFQYLNLSEYIIILLIYYYGFSVLEIAKKKQVSRQAINQVKKNALKKLKCLY